jgi:putative transposase
MARLVPGKAGDPGATGRDNRLFVEAVLWIARTGAPWRDLPAELGNWNSVWRRFARWAARGVWERLFAAMADDPDFEYVIVDATIVRAHQHSAGAKDPMGRRVCGLGKVRVPALTPPEAVAWRPRLHPQHLPPTWSLPRCSWRWN